MASRIHDHLKALEDRIAPPQSCVFVFFSDEGPDLPPYLRPLSNRPRARPPDFPDAALRHLLQHDRRMSGDQRHPVAVDEKVREAPDERGEQRRMEMRLGLVQQNKGFLLDRLDQARDGEKHDLVPELKFLNSRQSLQLDVFGLDPDRAKLETSASLKIGSACSISRARRQRATLAPWRQIRTLLPKSVESASGLLGGLGLPPLRPNVLEPDIGVLHAFRFVLAGRQRLEGIERLKVTETKLVNSRTLKMSSCAVNAPTASASASSSTIACAMSFRRVVLPTPLRPIRTCTFVGG